LSIPVTEGACAGKMRMFIRIFLRILPVATSAHPHFTPGRNVYIAVICPRTTVKQLPLTTELQITKVKYFQHTEQQHTEPKLSRRHTT